MDFNAKQLDRTEKNVVEKIAELRLDYLTKLPKKIRLVNDIWQKLTYFSWSDDAFSSLYRLIHGLTGTGKTFGFEALGISAKELEDYLSVLISQQHQPGDKERKHIESLIGKLALVSESLDPTNNATEISFNTVANAPSRMDKVVFVIDDDSHICLYLSTLLNDVGYQVRTFGNPALAIDYIASSCPDVVITDVVFENGIMDGIDAVNDVRAEAGKHIPIIFISARADLAARARVVRAGGNAYFTKPIDFNALVEKIDELSDLKEECRVLIVDDDPELSKFYAIVLKKEGMQTAIVNQPVEMLKKIADFSPDIILMDLYMPGYNGLELASVIRQDEKFIGLPIVFLSAESRESYYNQAIDLGANAFLTKPVSKEKLVNSIYQQVRQSRRIRDSIKKISKRDPSIGLYNRQYFLEQLDIAIASVLPGAPTKALIEIGIDNFEMLRRNFGIEWLDSFNRQVSAIICSQLTKEDIATHFSDSLYMVLADNRSTNEMQGVVKSICEIINQKRIRIGKQNLSITCSIGAVPINQHINTVHNLLMFTENLCEQLQKKGGNNYLVEEILPPEECAQRDLLERVETAMADKAFHLVYQPIVSVDHRGYEMYEVLVRLSDSDGKTILPSQFIPAAKDSGEIIDIDKWVIEHAIASLSEDRHARSSTDFLIKLSGKTIKENALIPSISNSLTQGGITGESRIIFHINEKDIVADTQKAVEFCRKVEKLHCGVSIDHYGVTDSSLRLLDMLHLSYVQLRDTVLSGLLEHAEIQVNVQRLIQHALNKDIKVIASNIEDPATLSLLWNMGVRYFQGYFIQQPKNALAYNFFDSVL